MSLSSMRIILGRLSPLHPYCYLILMYVIVLRYEINENEHMVLIKQDTPVSGLMSSRLMSGYMGVGYINRIHCTCVFSQFRVDCRLHLLQLGCTLTALQ